MSKHTQKQKLFNIVDLTTNVFKFEICKYSVINNTLERKKMGFDFSFKCSVFLPSE